MFLFLLCFVLFLSGGCKLGQLAPDGTPGAPRHLGALYTNALIIPARCTHCWFPKDAMETETEPDTEKETETERRRDGRVHLLRWTIVRFFGLWFSAVVAVAVVDVDVVVAVAVVLFCLVATYRMIERSIRSKPSNCWPRSWRLLRLPESLLRSPPNSISYDDGQVPHSSAAVTTRMSLARNQWNQFPRVNISHLPRCHAFDNCIQRHQSTETKQPAVPTCWFDLIPARSMLIITNQSINRSSDIIWISSPL